MNKNCLCNALVCPNEHNASQTSFLALFLLRGVITLHHLSEPITPKYNLFALFISSGIMTKH